MQKVYYYLLPRQVQNQCAQNKLPFGRCGEPDLLNLSKSMGSLISWSPPSLGSVKTNFDAAVIHGKVAIAYVIHNSDGNLILVTGKQVPTCPLIMLK